MTVKHNNLLAGSRGLDQFSQIAPDMKLLAAAVLYENQWLQTSKEFTSYDQTTTTIYW